MVATPLYDLVYGRHSTIECTVQILSYIPDCRNLYSMVLCATHPCTVNPVLKTTCIEGPPVYSDHYSLLQELPIQHYCIST